MLRTIPTALLCWLFLVAQSHGQDVFVPRELKAIAVTQSEKEHQPQIQKALPAKEPVAAKQPVATQPIRTAPVKAPVLKESPANPHSEKVQSVKAEPVKAPAVKEGPVNAKSEKIQSVKAETVKTPAVKEAPANPKSEKVQSVKAEPVKTPAVKEPSPNLPSARTQSTKVDPVKMLPAQEPTGNVQLLNRPMETASTRLADGFDFPVGKPDAEGYYKARGFRSGGHMGEDWDGIRGGDTDLNDPIYSIGDGIVVFARDVHLGWGNVVIVRHAYRENGEVKHKIGRASCRERV